MAVTRVGSRPRVARRAGARVVSATEAAKSFGGLVDRVRESGAVYVVERGGVPVAELGPVARPAVHLRELVSLLRSLAPADAAFAREVAAGVEKANKPSVPGNPWDR